VLLGGFNVVDAPQALAALGSPLVEVSNTKALGMLLYTEYLYPLEVATAILLVAMIAAIALTLRERKDSKHMDPGHQVRVKARDRMTVLKMESTRPAEKPEAPAPTPKDQA
jgi:NADH-quinone oxidoreductase subunit J